MTEENIPAEEVFGQVVEKKPKNADVELSITTPLFSFDKTNSPKEYNQIILEAEKMAQSYDLIQLVKEEKIHLTVLDQLNTEYEAYGRSAPKNIKEKVKAAVLQLSKSKI